MKKREVGRSGLYVSELGLGTMSLPNDLHESKKIIDTAIDAGVNFFDTADLYDGGKNEELVGEALKGKRQEIILATKVGNKLNSDGTSWSWDPSKTHITNAIKKSLTRLQTDYIDLYQLHGGTTEDDVEETIDAFESLKKEGLIRQYGISSIRPTVINRFLEKSTAVSVMMQYNMLDRRPEEWFPLIKRFNASVITRGTVAKGLLTSESLSRMRDIKKFANYDAPELSRIVEALTNDVGDLHAAAIAFALHDHTVTTALVGARTSAQLTESLIAYEKGSTNEEIEQLKNELALHHYEAHRL